MSRTRRFIAITLLLSFAVAACGNSGDDDAKTPDDPSDAPITAGDRDEHVAISGVPGVSDDEIAYDVVATKANNPLGTCISDCYVAGIKAYFAFRNSEGGIYGRDLVINQVLDDELGNNQARNLEVISAGDAFGTFQANLVASGWGDLDKAGIPTYVWGTQASVSANLTGNFPSRVVRCDTCTQHWVPYAAHLAKATRAASLGYGVTENSKRCAQGVKDSFELYGDAVGVEFAYLNDNLAYGLPNGVGPEVSAMKEAGVDFISTCLDLNAMKSLAQELQRQGMSDVVLYHPNTYNQDFVTEAGDLFEGDVVSAGFRPFEADAEGTALADFLTWIDKQGDEPTELAMTGWINASLAFDGLLAAGPDFTQAKVISATNKITDYTAGGLIEPTDWSKAHTPYTQAQSANEKERDCATFVRVVNGKFETAAPADEPWFCWPDKSATTWSEPETVSFK